MTVMDLTPAQQEIRASIGKICAKFGDDYWLAKDRDGSFPHDFHRALADAGWLGIAIPEAYGGSALGITEDTDAVAVVVSEENGQMSVVERARIVRVPTEAQLERALVALLESPSAPGALRRGSVTRSGRLRIRRASRRREDATPAAAPAPAPQPVATPPDADDGGVPAAHDADDHEGTTRVPDAPPPGDDEAATTAGVVTDR